MVEGCHSEGPPAYFQYALHVPFPKPHRPLAHGRISEKTDPQPATITIRAKLWSSGASPGLNPGKSVYFLLSGRFCCLGFSGVIFFCCLGGGVFFFCCLGGGVFFFCCLGGGVFFCFYCLGGGREFTHLPVCLARL